MASPEGASPEGASPHPGNRGTRPPAGLTFSPELGPSPLGGLCRNMGHLSCVERYPPPFPGLSPRPAAGKETGGQGMEVGWGGEGLGYLA